MPAAKTSNVAGFKLTRPAVVALVSYIALAFLVLLPIDMNVWEEDKQAYAVQKYNFGQRVLLALLILPGFILAVYSNNCLIAGNCVLWSWIIALLTALWAIIVIGTAFLSKSFKFDEVSSY